jgi:uncharacterized membrane protein YphA (DoxX/SURF4 family)
MTALERSLEPPLAPPRAGTVRAVISRFGFAYWLLFCIPMLSTQIIGVDWIWEQISPAWIAMIRWAGKHVLGISSELSFAMTGSGDKTSDWVALFCIASLALIITAIWSVVDRRRAHDERVRETVRIVARYTLAFVLLGYGVIKLFFGQFPPPNAGRLLQPYGESSPMGLLWTFMGASPAYVFFSGMGETLGAVLLLFRRTTTLGALVLGGVLTNIVMMNFCYDVPVKINSSHYLAMCIFLLIPDLGRLANVLVLNRATQPVDRKLILPKRWMRVARFVVKYGMIGFIVFTLLEEVLQRPGSDAPRGWYEGHWNVASFVRDGQDVPPILTDATRWKRIRFDARRDKIYVRWRFMDDKFGALYVVTIDDSARTMTFTLDDTEKSRPLPSPLTWRYEHPDSKHIKLEGQIGAETLVVQLERFEADRTLLMTRGFHWISEVPFNR